MRDKYLQQLDQLNDEIIMLGKLCESSVKAAVSLISGEEDKKKAYINRIKEDRIEIEKESHFIEDFCMQLLIRQQPVAGDMNTIAHALKLIRDMERIGNQALEVASIAKDLNIQESTCFNKIHKMSDILVRMITDSVNAFIKKDSVLACAIIIEDDSLDSLYKSIKTELGGQVFSKSNETEEAIDTLLIAKYLERMGDHTVMIARWIKEIS